MKKKKYDTSVVMLYLIGKEYLLPKEFRKQIPYSTIASWRKIDYCSYIGHEYRIFFEEMADYLALKKTCKEQRKMLRSIAKAWLIMQNDISPIIEQAKTNVELQKKLVHAIDCLKVGFGLRKTLKLLGLTNKIYQAWSFLIRSYCTASHSFQCVKRYPHQLQKKEVQKMRKLLTAPRLLHWPIVSIAATGLRRGSIVASMYSWYKYARLMELTHKTGRKPQRKVGLLAERPNEYLHVDTTHYLISDQKVCITFVMDNFSKMILGFQVAEKLSFEVVKGALTKALKIVGRHPDQQPVNLVADGGRENNNHHINQFIAGLTNYKITKIRSLKDIKFSNSPVEAIHKIIKSRYLHNHQFHSIQQLEQFLEWAVYDYNVLRPHYKHSPKTPHEVYFGIPLKFDVKERMKSAGKIRIQKNKELRCNACVNNALLIMHNYRSA
ncbi:DDE-type integrase/transposase/recombinase [Chitinophagaceae bacterium LB-8]|uniref:DDE-type integrase/transposase/recombinase n=1 Tax=Paraflavisolibacter caeni TaxID=2982496 RepID=A0A9X2Y036_9BACT|nr:DDE-type integrase/transposase/recombinase [Paraflavisolibacter caeni]MCU7552859.1 DDE-type integrase/transposase/recombinase [Paraflavisolibacter caeni]